MAAPATALRVSPKASVKSLSSSDYGVRGFCGNCGTHLYWKMKDDSMIAVWIGTLEHSDDLSFDTQIFIDSKPEHYAFTNETKNLTGAEVFAAVTGIP